MIHKSNYAGVYYLNNNYTATINAGQDGETTLIPPAGQVWYFRAYLFYVASPGATSTGTHQIDIRQQGFGGGWDSIAEIKAAHDGTLYLNTSKIVAGDSKLPANDTEIWEVMKTVPISNTRYITVDYSNDTDVNQTNDITITALFDVYNADYDGSGT